MDKSLPLAWLILTFALMSLSGELAAQGLPDSALIWKMELDEKIENVVFGVADDSSLYPCILVFDEHVRCWDSGRNELWRLSCAGGPSVTVSKAGRYVGAILSFSRPDTVRGPLEADWRLYDSQREEIATVTYQFREGGREFFVSDADGAFLEAYPSDQRLVLHDPDGAPRGEVDLFEDDEWNLGTSLRCEFSADGEYIAVLGIERHRGDRESRGGFTNLLLFRATGEELWRRRLTGRVPQSVSVSSRGGFVAGDSWVGPKRSVAAFNREGGLLGTYPARHHTFSGDERHLALAAENTVSLVETSTGRTLWSKELPYQVDASGSEWRWVTDLDVSRDGSLVAIAAATYRRVENTIEPGDPAVLCLGANGEELFRREMRGQKGEEHVRAGSAGDVVFVWGDTWIAKFAVSASL